MGLDKTYHALGPLSNHGAKMCHCQQISTVPKGTGSTAWLASALGSLKRLSREKFSQSLAGISQINPAAKQP